MSRKLEEATDWDKIFAKDTSDIQIKYWHPKYTKNS